MDWITKGNKKWRPLVGIWICGLAGLATVFFLWPAMGRATDTESAVRQAVSAWRQAWMNKDLERYAECYSDSFFASEPDRRAWLQRKSTVFRRPGGIHVEFSDLQIVTAEGRAMVTFTQHYSGPRLSDIGHKTMTLRLEEGNWRILREDWTPLKRVSGERGPSPPDPEVEEKPTFPEALEATAPTALKRPRAIAVSELPPFALGLWTTARSEHVCVRLDRPFKPVVTPDDPKARRIQVDISNVRQWRGPDQIFDGRWVRQITSHVDTQTDVLRIVVEVEPDSECVVAPGYVASDHLFCLDFAPSGRENGGRKKEEKIFRE